LEKGGKPSTLREKFWEKERNVDIRELLKGGVEKRCISFP